MRKVVVFGGCGFLGKEICNLLSKNKYDVLCIDKKIVKFNDKIKYQNLDILDKKKINIILKKTSQMNNFGVCVLRVDQVHPSRIPKIIFLIRMDHVVHHCKIQNLPEFWRSQE